VKWVEAALRHHPTHLTLKSERAMIAKKLKRRRSKKKWPDLQPQSNRTRDQAKKLLLEARWREEMEKRLVASCQHHCEETIR